MISTRQKGNTGEDIACRFIQKNGFSIIERNYYKRWGELDIIATRENLVHFFEVKSISYKKSPKSFINRNSFGNFGSYDPINNVHALKVKKLKGIIRTYLFEHKINPDSDFQFHVLCVYMNETTRRASVKWIDNVIL